MERPTESFVHLRKGRSPKRLHADLDGLKNDELGRGGFTGRTANIYRRHDPTAFRASGLLRPVDVMTSELKPSDATDAACTPLLLFSNGDCRISLSRRRLFEAIGHPDKEMHEIPGANHYYSGPAQRDTLRQAVGVCTDWLNRHGFSAEGRGAGGTSRPEDRGTTGESTP